MRAAKPLLLIAAGGTGGHMFPAQALAEAMLRRGWRVKLSTDARGARYAGGFPHMVLVEVVASASFARGGVRARAMVPFSLMRGILSALAGMLRDRPTVVAGFGGYPAVPAMTAAWLLRRPRLLHEQNGVLGRVNRFFAPRVDAVACGTWPTALPSGVTGIHIGNPVRAKVQAFAAADYTPPGNHAMTLLVIGGSQGARILSDVVPEAVARLPEAVLERLSVAHQARAEDVERVIERYRDAGVKAEVKPFFDDIPKRLAMAQLVVSRAGASSVAEISTVGRPSILVPFGAATGDHQRANARRLVGAGAAIMIPESRFSPENLSEQMAAILTNPHAAVHMAEAALDHARPDSTGDLVRLVETLSEKGRR